MVDSLEDQFGLAPKLLRAAESVFESLNGSAAGGEFVVEFAEACGTAHGRDLTDELMIDWAEASDYFYIGDARRPTVYEDPESAREELIGWLKAGAPEPVTA
jgi:hypothetical protein